MKSSMILKKAFQANKPQGWLFAALLCLQSASLTLTALVTISKKPASSFIAALLTVLSGLLFYYLLSLYFIRQNTAADPSSSEEKKGNKLLRSFTGAVGAVSFMAIITLGTQIASSNLIPSVYSRAAGHTGLVILFYALIILVLLLLQLILTAAFIVFATAYRCRIPLQSYAGWFVSALAQAIRKLPVSLAMMLIQLAALLFFTNVPALLAKWSVWLFPNVLAARFVSTMVLAAAEAFLLQYFINAAQLMMEDAKPPKKQHNFNPAVNIIIAAVLFLGLTAAGTLTNPVSANPVTAYEQIMDAEIAAGDLLTLGPSGMDLAENHFRRAYSEAAALEGFAYTLMFKAEPEKTEYSNKADAAFAAADTMDTGNPYRNLFKGYQAEVSKSQGEALRLYKIARSQDPGLTDPAFGILRMAQEVQDGPLAAQTLGDIQFQGFTGAFFLRLENLDQGGREKLLETAREHQTALKERMMGTILQKLQVNDVYGFYQAAQAFKDAEPDNQTALFLYGLGTIVFRNEISNYPQAEASFEQLSRTIPDNLQLQEYYGSVLLLSKQYDKAASFYSKLSEKYPDNLAFSEQYSYSLLAGNKDADALAVCDRILQKHEDDWFCRYIRAMACLKLGQYSESILSARKFVELTNKPELAQSRDTYLNAYLLAYAPATRSPDAVAALSLPEAKGLIADYALGMTAWRDKDYPQALTRLEAVLKDFPRLGYAWFAKGSVLNEKLIKDGSATKEEVEECYLKCASLEPRSLEVWFSLGNLYNIWEGHETDALRAFRRVVDLEPNSDHSHDYYGTVIHAIGAVDRLKAFDK